MRILPIIWREKTTTGRVITYCHLIDEKKNILSSGFSIQMPKDNFSRRKGREVAIDRATKNLVMLNKILPKVKIERREKDFITL